MIANVEEADQDGIRELRLTAGKHDGEERKILDQLYQIVNTHESEMTLTISICDGILSSELEGVYRG